VTQSENYRKMLLSMARDIRVILIKLADRLHNMRTLDWLDPERRRRISQETLDIYAPIAHRLGIARFKWELEDLAFKHLEPESYRMLVSKIAEKREERERAIEDVMGPLRALLAERGIAAEVTGRPKHLLSIWRKMQRLNTPFEEIFDLLGIRILTETQDDCYRVFGMVHEIFTPVADHFKDYIATPKSNMYQSLHTTVLATGGEMVEVQIRTREMHRTAETGIAAHYVYKQGGRVDEELDAKLGGFVAQTADWQRAATDDEYLEFLRTALYQEEVFAYTPRRELKRLPKGATALDFAFMIHTAVGQHTVGARVNGEIVPLRHVLQNGDMVEIITSPQAQPHEDWLHLLTTPGARGKVRHWLRQQRHTDSVALGREMIERELKRLRRRPGAPAIEEIAAAFGCSELEIFYARVAEGQISLTQVAHKLEPPREGLAERLAKGPLEALGLARRPATGGIRIQGLDNIMVSYARCCQPVPGDRVVGVVTVGRGVSVHRQDCPNTFGDRVPEERRVAVEWDVGLDQKFPVRLLVYGHDRTLLLADIAKTISLTSVNIRSAGVASEDRRARGVFVVEVPHLAKLREVIQAIRRVAGVTRVERRQRVFRPSVARGKRERS
jgi:GTP pyrophosphokinase